MIPLASDTFSSKSPELQPGLLDVIPKGSVPSAYINQYNLDYEVRCALCDKHTPHKKGYTAIFPDLGIALLGQNCGRKYFGEHNAKRFESDFQKKSQAALQCNRLSNLALTLNDASPLLRILMHIEAPLLHIMGELYDRFVRGRFEKQISANGELKIEDPHFRHVTIKNAKCLLSKLGTASKFDRAIEITQRFKKIQTADDVFGDLNSFLQSENELILALSVGFRFLRVSRQFLSGDNLKELNFWARNVDLGFDEIISRPAKEMATTFILCDNKQRLEFLVPDLRPLDQFDEWCRENGIRLTLSNDK